MYSTCHALGFDVEIHTCFHRMEVELQGMQTSQQEMVQQMEESRGNCHKFTAALSSIAPQVVYADDSKKRVSLIQTTVEPP